MARKNPAEQAEAAIAKVLKQREAARLHLAQLDETIARLTNGLGAVTPMRAAFIPAEPPITEEILELPDNLSPADTMGAGRLIP